MCSEWELLVKKIHAIHQNRAKNLLTSKKALPLQADFS